VVLNTVLTKQDQLDFFEPTSPGEPPVVDDELGETRRPEWAANGSLSILRGPLTLSWQTIFLSEQVLGYEDGGEIETARQNFGPAAFTGDTWIHNLTGAYEATGNLTVYGGVDNLTNERPFVTERAYPVSPRGRYFFMGVNVRL
jgi:outer membrane receptor protein involved in Fe transport